MGKFYATNRTNNEFIVLPADSTINIDVRLEFSNSFGVVPDSFIGAYIEAAKGDVDVSAAWPGSPVAFSMLLQEGQSFWHRWTSQPLPMPVHPTPCTIRLTNVTAAPAGSSSSSSPGQAAEVILSLMGRDD